MKKPVKRKDKKKPKKNEVKRVVEIPTPLSLKKIPSLEKPRFSSGISEFDRVLGGGIVPGAVILVGGEPGIGKSTLLLQVAHRLSQSKREVLYFCIKAQKFEILYFR